MVHEERWRTAAAVLSTLPFPLDVHLALRVWLRIMNCVTGQGVCPSNKVELIGALLIGVDLAT